MKTIALLFVSVFLVAAVINTKAQENVVKSFPHSNTIKLDAPVKQDAYITPSAAGSPNIPTQLAGVEGEIFVGSNWPAGTIVLRNGGIIDNYNLRYNIMTDQMQFIHGMDTLAFASPEELSTLTFDGHTFIYEPYVCDNSVRSGYFELIEPGKNKLLLKRLVTYEKPDPKQPDNNAANTYYIDECYFVSKAGNPANKMICSRKSVLSVLDDHDDEIKDYLRITGNKVRTIDDLKKLVSYYNSLDE